MRSRFATEKLDCKIYYGVRVGALKVLRRIFVQSRIKNLRRNLVYSRIKTLIRVAFTNYNCIEV